MLALDMAVLIHRNLDALFEFWKEHHLYMEFSMCESYENDRIELGYINPFYV